MKKEISLVATGLDGNGFHTAAVRFLVDGVLVAEIPHIHCMDTINDLEVFARENPSFFDDKGVLIEDELVWIVDSVRERMRAAA